MVKDLTVGHPTKVLVMFTVPMLIGNVFQQLYSMVDSVIVGRYVGGDALAAIGISFPITFFVISAILGLSNGVSVIVSQFFGAKDYDRLRASVSTGLISLSILTLLISILTIIFAQPILQLIKTPADIMDQAVLYLRIMFMGKVFITIYNCYAAMIRGVGDSKTPLYFLIISSVTNLVLDLLFVLVFKWGLMGAAVATVISQALSCILCIIYVYKKIPILRIPKKEFVFNPVSFRRILRYGIPSALQMSLMSLGALLLQGLINTFQIDAISGYTVAHKIDDFVLIPIMNLGNALSSFVGQNIGAGEMLRVRKGLYSALKLAVVFAIVLSVIIIPCSSWITGLFFEPGTSAAAICIGAEYLRVVGATYGLYGIMFVFIGLYRGAGDIFFSMVVTMANFIGRIASAYWLASIPDIGIQGIWWSIPIGWVLGGIIGIIRYKVGGWDKKSVIHGIR